MFIFVLNHLGRLMEREGNLSSQYLKKKFLLFKYFGKELEIMIKN